MCWEQLRRSSRRRKSSNEWSGRTEEHFDEYVLGNAEEENIESVKDESQVEEIVELSDSEFAADNDDIKDEYENETQEEHSQDTNNEEFEIQDKTSVEEHELECYDCQLIFSKATEIRGNVFFLSSLF